MLAKMVASSGDTLWTRAYAQSGQNSAVKDIALSPDESTVLLAGAGGNDALLLAASASNAGVISGSKTFGGTENDNFFSVVADTEFVYACGTSFSPGFTLLSGSGIVLKASLSDGSKQWAFYYSSSDPATATTSADACRYLAFSPDQATLFFVGSLEIRNIIYGRVDTAAGAIAASASL